MSTRGTRSSTVGSTRSPALICTPLSRDETGTGTSRRGASTSRTTYAPISRRQRWTIQAGGFSASAPQTAGQVVKGREGRCLGRHLAYPLEAAGPSLDSDAPMDITLVLGAVRPKTCQRQKGRRIEPDDKCYTKKPKAADYWRGQTIRRLLSRVRCPRVIVSFGPYATGLNCFKGVVDLRWGDSGSPE